MRISTAATRLLTGKALRHRARRRAREDRSGACTSSKSNAMQWVDGRDVGLKHSEHSYTAANEQLLSRKAVPARRVKFRREM